MSSRWRIGMDPWVLESPKQSTVVMASVLAATMGRSLPGSRSLRPWLLLGRGGCNRFPPHIKVQAVERNECCGQRHQGCDPGDSVEPGAMVDDQSAEPG